MNKHVFRNDEYSSDHCINCGLPRFADPDDPRRNKCRPAWDETWMGVARTIAERSYDPFLKVGAIIVSEDNTRMLSVGYNGNYAGGPNQRESDLPGEGGLLHAELNAIIKCDYNFPKKKIMYVTHSPCKSCCKIIVNAGISKIVYGQAYRDTSGLKILDDCGVEVIVHQDSNSSSK